MTELKSPCPACGQPMGVRGNGNGRFRVWCLNTDGTCPVDIKTWTHPTEEEAIAAWESAFGPKPTTLKGVYSARLFDRHPFDSEFSYAVFRTEEVEGFKYDDDMADMADTLAIGMDKRGAERVARVLELSDEIEGRWNNGITNRIDTNTVWQRG